MGSIAHAALFVTFVYLGFIRKWKRHSIRGELKKREFLHVKTGPFVFLGIEEAENVPR